MFVGVAYDHDVLSSTKARGEQNMTFLLPSAEIIFLSGRDVGVGLGDGLRGNGQLPLGLP